jgi:hypothetical protein
MKLGITLQYRLEKIHLLHTVWHEGRESCTIEEPELLIGKNGRLGQGFRSVFQLISMLYTLSVFALRENKELLILTSSGYIKLTKRAKAQAKVRR